MKKLLLTALTALTINTVTTVAGERTAQGPDIYNPNNYRVEYDAESQLTLLIPDYFKMDRTDYQNKILDTLDNALNDLSSEDFDILIQRVQEYIDDLI